MPAIIDGAAQDVRIGDLLATGADLVLISAHKYLSSPTAGLFIGRNDMVDAVRAHEKGIGRAMKPTKEAICGVLAAIEERQETDLGAWSDGQESKVAGFVKQANEIPGVQATSVPDPFGMPFPRAHLSISPSQAAMEAEALAKSLKAGDPSIWVMEHALKDGQIILELVRLTEDELEVILARISKLLSL